MSKSPLIFEDEEEQKFDVVETKVKEVQEKTNKQIPASFVEVMLPSNGRIKGIPKVLHFRDYSASEALDISTATDQERPRVIADTLTQMCYEKYNIKQLPLNDVLQIVYFLHASFISNNLSKEIYLDETLPEGVEKGHLDNPSNIEEVDIPISSLSWTLLGKDKNDQDLNKEFKVPFSIKDKKTNDKISFKLTTLEDTIFAQNYVKNYYEDEYIRFASVRKNIDDIQHISNVTLREEKLDEYLDKNYDLCKEYSEFDTKFMVMTGKVLQALQIVAFNDKPVEDIKEKWDIYNTIPVSIWEKYQQILDKFQFGLNSEVEVYSNKLNKKLVRTITFQLSDFLLLTQTKDDDRYDVLFD